MMHSRFVAPLFLLVALASAACGDRATEASRDQNALEQEGPVTYENFVTHPRILEVDALVAASHESAHAEDATIETKGVYSADGQPEVCGYGEIGRRLFVDARGRVRKAQRLFATDHTGFTSTMYFDETGALRYVLGEATQEDGANLYRHETRAYLNAQGQVFFEAFRTATWPMPSSADGDLTPDFESLPFGAPEPDGFWSVGSGNYPENATAARPWFESPGECG